MGQGKGDARPEAQEVGSLVWAPSPQQNATISSLKAGPGLSPTGGSLSNTQIHSRDREQISPLRKRICTVKYILCTQIGVQAENDGKKQLVVCAMEVITGERD